MTQNTQDNGSSNTDSTSSHGDSQAQAPNPSPEPAQTLGQELAKHSSQTDGNGLNTVII